MFDLLGIPHFGTPSYKLNPAKQVLAEVKVP